MISSKIARAKKITMQNMFDKKREEKRPTQSSTAAVNAKQQQYNCLKFK